MRNSCVVSSHHCYSCSLLLLLLPNRLIPLLLLLLLLLLRLTQSPGGHKSCATRHTNVTAPALKEVMYQKLPLLP